MLILKIIQKCCSRTSEAANVLFVGCHDVMEAMLSKVKLKMEPEGLFTF